MYKGIIMSYLKRAANKDAPLATYSTFINLRQRLMFPFVDAFRSTHATL